MEIIGKVACRFAPRIVQVNFHCRLRLPFLQSSSVFNRCSIHTTRQKCGLEEFFDLENFDSKNIAAGRPWRTDELRIKSNQDLHKLWYILLKERNMLMTMEHMYTEAFKPFIGPERIFKVEESMENILEVVKERNIAYDLLEKGTTDFVPNTKVVRNAVGIPTEVSVKEHVVPESANIHQKRLFPNHRKWMDKYMPLYEEKLRKKRNYEYVKYEQDKKKLMEEFDLSEDEIPEFSPKNKELEEFLKRMNELNDVGDKEH